ncbi:endoglucanase 19-like [Vitis riparia]|uniref:endoglucanase 19-like n=1 Tax=Vitis riparia TaxID=96939 RepID=UPI00155A1316|nr:endoglucanase 19-like [Vitis riparia]
MVAASIVFRRSNPSYANELPTHARQLFEFGDKYRGKYDSSITVAQKYYWSYSEYADELLWAAVWLYQAINSQYYLSSLGKNGQSLGGTGWSMTELGWDAKYAGVQVLVAKMLMQGKVPAMLAADRVIHVFMLGGRVLETYRKLREIIFSAVSVQGAPSLHF